MDGGCGGVFARAAESSRYRLSPAAIEDMAAIVDYLDKNPVAALRFVEAVDATSTRARFPR
jgi:plasmid stabilization system protein ParE